jgi:hypothetical protein
MGVSRALSILISVVVGLIATAKPSPAQTSDGQAVLPAAPIPLVGIPSVSPSIGDSSELAQRMSELQQWVGDYTEWKTWDDRWRGRVQPGWFGPRERRRRPDPPAWLSDKCRDEVEVAGTVADACRLLVAWREDYAAEQVRAKILAQRDEASKTTWWRHVHVDALWVTPGASVSYGVVGIHVTLNVVGRWQIFVAPGAILLNVPTRQRTRAWQPATDLGISYRLIDLQLPGSRQGTLHLNLARAWLLGGSDSFINSSVDLAGLSLTFK